MIIETERLVLRPFTEEDAGDVLEYLREPAVNCFACMKLNSLEEAKAEMQKLFDKEQMKQLIIDSSSASNNINQIARRVNSTGNIYADDLAEIKEQQSQILHQLLKLRGEIHIVKDLVESSCHNIGDKSKK